MKTYGERLSRTERVLWAADECGLDYDHIPVPVNGEKGEALLAINPDGAIPTLDDNGFVVTQSWAINLYNAIKLQRPLDSLNRTLASRPYVAGERFTIGDLNAVSIVSWLTLTGFDFTSLPTVKQWIDRCMQRSAFPKRG